MKEVPQQAAFYRHLGENIRAARKRSELSQDGLARLVGLTRTSLTNIENGRQHPPLHTLCEIVEHLQVTVSDLLPRSLARTETVDITAVVGQQLRGDDELAFVKSAIGLEKRETDGDSETQNSSDSRDASN